MDRDKILSKAKIGLMTKGSVFLCTIAFSLKYMWCDKTKTASIDGEYIRINEKWFSAMRPAQRVGLLAHEAWHMALNHVGEFSRQGKRDPKLFNIAGDYVINQLVVDANMELPDNGYQNDRYRGWTTNAVYDDIFDKAEKIPDVEFSGDLKKSDVPDEALEAHVKSILVKAATQSAMAKDKPGSIPNEIQRKIDDLLNPILPWDTILDRFLTDMVAEDFSWRRPNRRFQPKHFLPTRNSESLGHLIIAIDTSGSVSDKQMKEILSEITYIKTKFNPNKLTILDCDTEIHNIYEIGPNDSIGDLEFSGYGGTRCAPPIEYAKKHNAQALLYFTDGEFTPYPDKVHFPLLWIIYDNPNWKSNIGEVIIYGHK